MSTAPQATTVLPGIFYTNGNGTVTGTVTGKTTPFVPDGHDRRCHSNLSTSCPIDTITNGECGVLWTGDASQVSMDNSSHAWYEALPMHEEGSGINGSSCALSLTSGGTVLLDKISRYRKATMGPASSSTVEMSHLLSGPRSTSMPCSQMLSIDMGIGEVEFGYLGLDTVLSADGMCLAASAQMVPAARGGGFALFASRWDGSKYTDPYSVCQMLDVTSVDSDQSHWIDYSGFGGSSAFSRNGDVLATSMGYYSYGPLATPYAGAIAMFKFDSESWQWKPFKTTPIVQIPLQYANSSYRLLGQEVRMSGDGRMMAVINPDKFDFGTGTTAGAVWVFSVDPDTESVDFVRILDTADPADTYSQFTHLSVNDSGSVLAYFRRNRIVKVFKTANGERLSAASASISSQTISVLDSSTPDIRISEVIPRLSADGHYMVAPIDYDIQADKGWTGYRGTCIYSDMLSSDGSWMPVSGPWHFDSGMPCACIDDAGEVVHVCSGSSIDVLYRRGTPDSWFYDKTTCHISVDEAIASSDATSVVNSSKNTVIAMGYPNQDYVSPSGNTFSDRGIVHVYRLNFQNIADV